jgi:aminomethyltransferase
VRAYQRARRSAGLVDLSSTEKVRLEGPDAEALLNQLAAGNLADLAVGDILQTVLLEEDGTVEAIVWILRDQAGYLLLGPDESWRGIHAWIAGHRGSHDATVVDATAEFGLVSVIGPAAQDVLVDYIDQDLLRLSYCQFMEKTLLDTSVRLCRYGDSGEYDYRLLVPAGLAARLLADLQERTDAQRFPGNPHETALTLAMEMKSFRPEFFPGPTLPTQGDLHWMVHFRKEDFLGAARLKERMPQPLPRALLLVSPVRELPEGPVRILLGGREVGEVQRSAYSPTLKGCLVLGYVEAEFAWPGLPFALAAAGGATLPARSKSAPLFVTKTVTDNLNM